MEILHIIEKINHYYHFIHYYHQINFNFLIKLMYLLIIQIDVHLI